MVQNKKKTTIEGWNGEQGAGTRSMNENPCTSRKEERKGLDEGNERT